MLLARRYFNGPLDGLIYGALIGGGFAFTENIIYYSRQLESFGVGGMVVLVIIRGVLNIFGHAIYTSMTGVLIDRKSTRLNSSHVAISYAVFCLKKQNEGRQNPL